MRGTLKLYSMHGSLSSGEYPLLPRGQSLSPYLLETFERIKYRDGLQAAAVIPYTASVASANVASIDNRFYWITEYRERTAEDRTYELTLDYMGPTDLFRSGDSMTAYLERSPSYLKKYLRDDFTGGQTAMYDIREVGNTASGDTDNWVFWLQVTGMVNVGGNDLTQRYGCFVGVPRDNRSYLWTRLWASGSTQYPSIGDIINYISWVMPFVPSQVIDISISKRCPYRLKVSPGTEGYITNLVDSSGTVIAPTASGSGPAVTYYLDSLVESTLVPYTQTITFSIDDYARMCGSISLRDKDKNKVASFPIQQGGTFTVWTVGDYTGIYTVIDNGYQRAVIPEGKLPWNSDTWSEYKAYDMSIDRQTAANAMRYAAYEFETQDVGGGVQQFGNAISSMIFGGIAGKGGGALAGGVSGALNLWASGYMNERAYDLAIMQAQDNYRMSQMRAKNTRGTAYNTGYGTIYVEMSTAQDLILGIEGPMADGRQLMSDYVGRHGYPCEGLVTIQAQTGYMKGTMPSTSTLRGMWFDQFNLALSQGFRYVDP